MVLKDFVDVFALVNAEIDRIAALIASGSGNLSAADEQVVFDALQAELARLKAIPPSAPAV